MMKEMFLDTTRLFALTAVYLCLLVCTIALTLGLLRALVLALRWFNLRLEQLDKKIAPAKPEHSHPPAVEMKYSITQKEQVQPGVERTKITHGTIPIDEGEDDEDEIPPPQEPVAEKIECGHCRKLIASKPLSVAMRDKKAWVTYKCEHCGTNVVIHG